MRRSCEKTGQGRKPDSRHENTPRKFGHKGVTLALSKFDLRRRTERTVHRCAGLSFGNLVVARFAQMATPLVSGTRIDRRRLRIVRPMGGRGAFRARFAHRVQCVHRTTARCVSLRAGIASRGLTYQSDGNAGYSLHVGNAAPAWFSFTCALTARKHCGARRVRP